MFVFVGVPGVSSTDTNNPLFLGGHPYPQRIGNTDRQTNHIMEWQKDRQINIQTDNKS